MYAGFLLLSLSASVASGRVNTLQSNLTASGVSALFPTDAGYSSARQAYNQRFDIQPAAVVYPTTPAQVSDALKAATANNVKVSARSGGHSYVANGLGGKNGVLVVDLSQFKKITVDSAANTAYIEAGNRLGDIAINLNNFGRAIPHGSCPYVGMGGHAGGGGFGFASRMWGLTLDAVLSANVVLANGTITTASATQNSDLFWAIRGSAGSFGIVTSFIVKTFPVPTSATIFRYEYDLNAATAAKAVASLQTFATNNLSPLLGAEYNIGKGSSQGRVSLEFVGGWYGPAADLQKTIKPLLDALPLASSETITPGDWISSVQALAGDQNLDTTSASDTRDTFYAKSLMTPSITNQQLTTFFTYLGKEGFASNTEWFIQFELYGGSNSAVNTVAAAATSFARRSSLFTIQLYASSSNYSPPYPAAGFTLVDGMVSSIVSGSPSGWEYGAYVNYIDDRLADWQTRYYGSNYARLRTLKRQFDPSNVFSFSESIEE